MRDEKAPVRETKVTMLKSGFRHEIFHMSDTPDANARQQAEEFKVKAEKMMLEEAERNRAQAQAQGAGGFGGGGFGGAGPRGFGAFFGGGPANDLNNSIRELHEQIQQLRFRQPRATGRQGAQAAADQHRSVVGLFLQAGEQVMKNACDI